MQITFFKREDTLKYQLFSGLQINFEIIILFVVKMLFEIQTTSSFHFSLKNKQIVFNL